MTLVLKEVTLLTAVYDGSSEGVREFTQAAEFIARHPGLPEAVVTQRFPLADAAEAFRVAADRASGAIKALLRTGT